MLKRASLLTAGPLAALAVTVASPLLRAGELPDPVAVHWSTGGAPDGHAPLWALIAPFAAIQLLAAIVLLRQARGAGAGGGMALAPGAWATAAILAAVAVVAVDANAGAASWEQAAELGIPTLLAVFAGGAVAWAAAWAIARGLPVAAPPEAGGPAMALGAGERAVWSRRLVSRPARAGSLALGAVLVGAGIVTGGAGAWALVAGGVAAALLTGSLSEIAVTVDGRGLTIAYGPLGWPRQTVALERIAHAEATEIDPWSAGGWGYRKVPRDGRLATAVVLRRGEGIRLVRDDGRELLVTIPDAERGAALLEALRARAAA